MKIHFFVLSLGTLSTLPVSAMAAMTPMMSSEMADVAGQAYVLQFGSLEKTVPDLTQRDVPVVSDKARAVASTYPGLTSVVRQGIVTGTNTALGAGKTAIAASVATVPGVGTIIAPVVFMLPTPRIGFQ
jgi:hypothetical protein